MFEHHSFHLGVEFVVDLFLHLSVHCLHELLEDVFEVQDFAAFAHLVFEGFVYAHYVGGF